MNPQQNSWTKDLVKAYLSAAAAQVFETDDIAGSLMALSHQTVGPAFMRRLAWGAVEYFELLDQALSPTARAELAQAQALVASKLKAASS